MEEIHSDDGSNAEFEEGLQSEGDYESGDEEYDEDDGDLIIPGKTLSNWHACLRLEIWNSIFKI